MSMTLGALMATGGAAVAGYMFLYASQPVKLVIWSIPITVMALGVAILWDDIRG
ncbi:hypothetical protein HJA87_22600 [Rhizobium bangladeshense]|uniref:Uncharacterized protein n=2 Tax=Rhizobium bangladeshense TaxID=1138189 RepID=A0ABS7LN19_9HYPH|nr:hypothetical protein [Rhizobium bangladeshense]MBX4869324.1 hypothetical protein [Rhizobium bangladeshense]MBX4874721.1 hypothetical protein [Rhizobium bangladeshense]MBX4885238.1 hypothetical protein [Rhizobium bangladeshense]MBX4899167.1 hypothetical protein [Rhizobium bangladeshense]MBX4932107.1 hypothetical protein [Rhizobium bangladeshense]